MSRVFYSLIFYLIYSVTELALLVIAIIQLCLNLFSDEPSGSLKSFGMSLGIYVKQIAEYLSFASDQKPYPFSDWPSVEARSESDEELLEIKH